MRPWWKAIEEQLDAKSELAPDPWSGRTDPPVALTGEQQRFLTAIEDQPATIRVSDLSATESPAADS